MSEFTDYLEELLTDLGPVRARRMLGGHGLFLDGLMFALVADDTLYLKADAETEPEFQARGLSQFTYVKKGREVHLSYWRAPAEVLDDPEIACDWARRAHAAARRSQGGGRARL